jgi:hypothetical protein
LFWTKIAFTFAQIIVHYKISKANCFENVVTQLIDSHKILIISKHLKANYFQHKRNLFSHIIISIVINKYYKLPYRLKFDKHTDTQITEITHFCYFRTNASLNYLLSSFVVLSTFDFVFQNNTVHYNN